MRNLKRKAYNELICTTETDSLTLKNLRLPKETGCREGWTGSLGWKLTTINIIKFIELKNKFQI